MNAQPMDYVCLECGKRLTLSQAERAMNGDKGCPKCGGSDIDLFVESRQDPSQPPCGTRYGTAGAREIQAESYAEAKQGA